MAANLRPNIHAGFDPTGDRLAVWGVDGNRQVFVQLYNLTSHTPQAPIWHIEGVTGSLALGFSGHGKYLMALVQSSAGTATGWVADSATEVP